ncbi:uncharacterized protein LOC143923389 [Lithobates pipiens]
MKHSVGIFSRSDKGDYAWLVTLLSSSDFSDCVQDVRSTVISNSGFQQFIDDASQCSLGILYHTKNRGRVNITDIPGSLYDEELDNLNQLLGRDNVIVVTDDVGDSSHKEKIRILEGQPTIRKLATDLLLISKTDKNNTKTLMTKLRTLTPFNSTSALQESIPHKVPEPLSGKHNLEETLTNTNKTKHGTKDIKPLHGDKSPNTKSTYDFLKPWISNNSPEVSFSNESPQIWNDYVSFKSTRKSSIPRGSNKESEIPLSPPKFCNIYYESQKLPSSIESLETWHSSETENIYETIDSWINDKPDPKPKEKSKDWYSYEHSEMLSGNGYQKDEFCSKTFNIGIDSEISEELPGKGYPTNQLNNETYRMRYSSENSKKPPTDNFSEIHFFNKPSEIGYTYKSSEPKPICEGSKELCDNSDSMCKGESLDTPLWKISPKPPSAGKSANSQFNFSDVMDELKDHYPTNQLNNETSRMRYSSENSKKPPTDEVSEIHFFNKPSEIGYTYKSSEPKPICEGSKELCDNSDSMCKGESLDTQSWKLSPKPLTGDKIPNSQSDNVNFSDVIEELKRKLNKIKN